MMLSQNFEGSYVRKRLVIQELWIQIAEGVLPVCLGKGTKLCDMLTGTKKQYKVSFVFEKETDTEDIWGTVTKTHEPLKQDAIDQRYNLVFRWRI